MTTVRWGFLGAGWIATKALAPAVRAAAGAELAAVAARDLSRAAALGGQRAYGSYAELLADPAVDAVYLSLTNEAHLPWVLRALAAGKHVLCEKPLGLTAAEVDQMAAAAAAAGRQLVEASWYRWHPRVRLAQQRLTGIGPVRHVLAEFRFDGPPAGNYRLEVGRGGGALYDVGCYCVSACLWAFGGALPVAVTARQQLGLTGVDVDTRLLLDFADGGTAEVQVGFTGGSRQQLVMSGAAGEVELRGEPFTSWQAASELWVSDGSRTDRLVLPPCDAYQLMVEEMSAALGGGAGYLLPLWESRATAAVLDAARTSAAAGGAPVAPA